MIVGDAPADGAELAALLDDGVEHADGEHERPPLRPTEVVEQILRKERSGFS